MAARKRPSPPPPSTDPAAPEPCDASPLSGPPTSSQVRKKPPPHVIRELSVKSRRHPKTVERWLAGKPVRPIVEADLSAAATALGIERVA